VHLTPGAAVAQVLFLDFAIAAMFASRGALLVDRADLLLGLLAPVLGFFAVNFALAQIVGHAFGVGYEDRAALALTTLARNSPISLAIAAATFPDRPLISLALVIGPLIELPVLAVITRALLRLRRAEVTPR
jgi:ACR3 family arsenite efflux pump ArsB